MFKIINTNKYDSLVERLLYAFYFVHQLSFVVSASCFARNVDIAYKIIIGFTIFTFLLMVLCDLYYLLRGNFNIYEIVIFTVIGIIFLISFYNYRSVMVMANLVGISVFKNVNCKKALKYFLYATIIGIIINFLFGVLTPFTGDTEGFRYTVIGFIKRKRYAFGFFYPTILHFYYMTIVMVFLVVKERLNNIEYVSLMLINIVLYIITDTKAPLLYITLMLVIHFVLTRFDIKILYLLFGIGTTVSYILLFFISFFLSMLYNPSIKFFQIADRVILNRLHLTHGALEKYGFALFGQTVPITMTLDHVDSSMISMLMLNGALVFIICIIFMTYFSYISYKTKKISLLVALFAIAIRASFDLGFMAMQLSPVVVMFLPTLYEFLNVSKK